MDMDIRKQIILFAATCGIILPHYSGFAKGHVQAHKEFITPPPLISTWKDWVTVKGSVSVGAFGSNRTPTTAGVIPGNIGSSPAATDLSVTFADVTFDAKPIDWLETLVEISYQQRSPSFIRSPAGGGNVLFVNQAYANVANAACTPFYAKIGRTLIDFGGLDASSLLESTTQLLTLNRETVAQVGFKQFNHFDGSIYAFRGMIKNSNRNRTLIDSVGARLGYGQKWSEAGYHVGVDYLSNIINANYTSATVANGSTLNAGYYHRTVPALDLNAKGNWRAFDVNANYVAALNAFSVLDVPFTTNGGASFRGAKPSAWGINGGYAFDVLDYKTRFGIGYQGSKESVALGSAAGSVANAISGVYGTFFAIGMPLSRYYANYNINLVKWADVGMELARDQGYSSRNGGIGRSAFIGVMMLTARMA